MLELMGNKKRCRRIMEVVSGTAVHKFTVFHIQPSRFYTFGEMYLFFHTKMLIINILYDMTSL
jgi:hypothetical protein